MFSSQSFAMEDTELSKQQMWTTSSPYLLTDPIKKTSPQNLPTLASAHVLGPIPVFSFSFSMQCFHSHFLILECCARMLEKLVEQRTLSANRDLYKNICDYEMYV